MSERAGDDDERPESFLDRTFLHLRNAWHDLAAPALGVAPPAPRPDLPKEDAERLRGRLRACLEAVGGDVSAQARAAGLGRAYLSLSAKGRERFLRILAEDFDPDRAAVDAAIENVRVAPDPAARRAAERVLHRILQPPRLKLLTQFNGLPEGVKFLVDMRAELLPLARSDPALAALEADLKGLLESWFDIGFLDLRRITWESPATLLEKLIAYEAVHEIRGWTDLKNRLDSDRRCFAFFHPNMPEEPLIFVEVALVRGMADSVQALLDEAAPVDDPGAADTAIFYSISNAQHGLAGISFGGFLIKRVADVLATEFKSLKVFATLSPIPGFMRWLGERVAADEDDKLLTPAEAKALAALPTPIGDARGLLEVLELGLWPADETVAKALQGPLMRLCAHYLIRERRPDGRVRDRVANFHLSNGARMERLNWRADSSEPGLRRSAGMMLNYLYRLDDIEANHEAYKAQGKIATSSAMRALLRG